MAASLREQGKRDILSFGRSLSFHTHVEEAGRVLPRFSVSSGELQTGSQNVAALQQRCQLIAEYVIATLSGMAGAAGHPDLTSALTDATGRGNRALTGMWAAYGYASQGLSASAQSYIGTEQFNLSNIARLG